MAEKNRGGRPRKHPEGVHRPVMSFRIRQDLYDKLNNLASPKGYSLSEILSKIVEQHFDGGDLRTLIREEIRAALAERDEAHEDRCFGPRPEVVGRYRY